MKYCSMDAFARCPLAERCGDFRDAYFMEGSECDAFNQLINNRPRTNADKIRSMSDAELAMMLSDDDRCCPPVRHNCHKYVGDCAGCHLEWLQQPAREG